MEININKKTRFSVGDTVYFSDTRSENILSGKIEEIKCFFSTKRPNECRCIYDIRLSNGSIYVMFEDLVYKTEYEARIALGNKK